MGDEETRGRLLVVVTEDYYFLSHRLRMARAARDAGWEVFVATRRGERVAEIEAEGFPHIALELDRGSTDPLKELRTIASMIATFREVRPDVVHLVAVKPIVYGAIAARAAGVRRVLCAVAGLGFLYLGGGGKRLLMKAFVERVYRVLVCGRVGTRVLVQNRDDRELMIERGLALSDQIDVVPGSGVDLRSFQPTEPPGTPPARVLTHCRMLWDKGIGELVEAARRLQREGIAIEVVLVGDPDPQNPASIDEEQLREWEAEGVVRWLGHRRDIPELLASAHIACLPSYREGMPLSLLEACASGRAIVTTDVPGCRDVVEEGVNGLLAAVRDVDTLAAALRRLVEDGVLRERMGYESRLRAERLFADEAVNGAIVAIYERL